MQPRLVDAVVPDRLAVADLDQRVGHVADEVAVVGHEQHGSGIGDQRILEDVAAREVEVVRRLVEHEQVHRVHHRLGEGEAGLLSARERAHQPIGGLAREPERAQDRAHVAVPRVRADRGLELLDHDPFLVEHIDLVLGEAGDVDVVAEHGRAGHGGELTEHDLEERGLAGAVGAEEGDLAAALDDEVDVADHGFAVVSGGDAVQLDDDATRSARLGEGEPGDDLLAGRDLDAIELLQGLDAALHLSRLGRLIAEPFDKPLDLGHLLGLIGGRRLEDGQALLALHHELDEPADVLGGRLVGELDDPVGHVVDEVTIVADEQQRTAPRHEVVLEPRRAVDVEVVGGFVEDQDVGVADEQASQRHAHPPAAGQLGDGTVGIGGGETEAGQDPVGLRFQGVAALLLEVRLDLAVAVEQLGIGRAGAHPALELVQLVGQVGEPGCPEHDVEHRTDAEVGDLLGQVADAEVLGPVDLADVRLLLAQEHLDEGGLTGPVTADEGDAPAGADLQADVAEQGPRAVGLAELGRGDHAEQGTGAASPTRPAGMIGLRTRIPTPASGLGAPGSMSSRRSGSSCPATSSHWRPGPDRLGPDPDPGRLGGHPL